VWIIPYGSKNFDLADEGQNLVAAIGEDFEGCVALANLSEQRLVAEDRDHGLTVEEYPGHGYHSMFGLHTCEGETHASVCIIWLLDLEKLNVVGIGTHVGVVPFGLATKTRDVGM